MWPFILKPKPKALPRCEHAEPLLNSSKTMKTLKPSNAGEFSPRRRKKKKGQRHATHLSFFPFSHNESRCMRLVIKQYKEICLKGSWLESRQTFSFKDAFIFQTFYLACLIIMQWKITSLCSCATLGEVSSAATAWMQVRDKWNPFL